MPLKVDPNELLSMSVTDALRDALAADLAAYDQSTISFMDWSMKVPETRGPLNFERWPFQRELYEQGYEDKDMVLMKATQLGISAWLVRWALYWADVRGARVVYVFPRERQLLDFSDGRVKPLILSKYLRTRVDAASVQNKALKSVGLGLVYFRGSEAEAGLESIDADAIALDEYDLLVPAHIPVVERRIGASELGLTRRIGFPTIADRGIHREFAKTDQRKWHVKCEACGEWQSLDFFKNVDTTLKLRVCASCRKPLDVKQGEWVATFPGRDTRGYHITKLVFPDTDLNKLVAASEQREPYKRQVFFNRDLGEAWEGEGNRLTPAMIAAAQRAEVTQEATYTGANRVIMGVDVASVRALNVWISEQLSDTQGRTLFVGLVESFNDLCTLMDRYRVNMACIDHLPEGRLARAFANRFHGRVYIVNYSESQKDVITVDDQQARVSVRRTEAIDSAAERVRSQREYLPMDLPDGFVEQLCTNVRSTEQDDVGRVRVVYRADGPDDWMQALTYLVVANECWWIREQVSGKDQLVALEDELDFERSTLNQHEAEPLYSPGRGDGDYALSDETHVDYVDEYGHSSYDDF